MSGMKIQVGINDVSRTLARYQIQVGNGAKGKSVEIHAQKNVRYELIDEETRFAPENIATKRVGSDLHVAFEGSDIEQPDLVITDYYKDPGTASVVGQAEDGLYYNYVPESGLQQEAISRLSDNLLAGQALGGERLPSAFWPTGGAPVAGLLGVVPLLAMGAGGIGGGTFKSAQGTQAIGSGDTTAPVVGAGQSFGYDENQAAGTVVATVSASDTVGVTQWRFGNGTQLSDDGYYQIDAGGRITLTAAGAAAGAASNDHETGPNSFTLGVQAGDAAGNWSALSSVELRVQNVNEAPVGASDTYTITEGTTSTQGTVLGNDTDVDTAHTLLTVSQFAVDASGTGVKAANGSNTITTVLGGTVKMLADGTFVYTAPVRNHADTTPDVDSFYYRVSDGALASGWTKVAINVTDTTPVANPDVDSVGMGATISGNVITGAGGNTTTGADVFTDTPATVTSVSYGGTTYAVGSAGATIDTVNGKLKIYSDGSYSFESNYRNILVAPSGGAAPTIAQWTNTAAGGVAGIYGFDGSSPLTGANLNLSSLTNSAAGYVRYLDDWFLSSGLGVERNSDPWWPYTNSKVQNGEFIVFDLGGLSSAALVTLTDVSDQTEASRITWYAFGADGTQVATGTASGASISGSIATLAILGSVNYRYLAFTSTNGSADFRVNGLTATPVVPNANEVFTYTLTDADGSTASTTLTITSDNQPQANNDTTQVYEAGLSNGTLAGQAAAPTVASGNLFANDGGISPQTTITSINGSTPSGETITLSDAQGTLVVNATTGAYTYTLNAPANAAGDFVNKAFSYTVTDAISGQTSSATLTVKIVDDAPIGTDISQTLQASSGLPTYNLVLVLDRSGSMAQDADGNWSGAAGFDPNTVRMQIAKQALAQLIQRFDGLGNVNVKIVDFSSTVSSSSWFIDDATGAVRYLDSIQADGGTRYDLALREVMSSWGAPPAADKTLFYFVTDGQPSDGGGITTTSNPTRAAWENFVNSQGGISFAIGIGSAGLGQLLPIAYPNTANGTSEPYAITLTDPLELQDTLLATVNEGIVMGETSVLAGSGAAGFVLGADGGAVNSIVVDGVTYTATTGNQQTFYTNRGGVLTFNFATGRYSYALQVNKTIQGQEEVFQIIATDGDGDTKTINLKVILDYYANLDANQDMVLTNVQAGQAISLSAADLLHNDACGNAVSVTGTSNAVRGVVSSGAGVITFTPSASGVPQQAVKVIAEGSNDNQTQTQNNVIQNAVDFTDRTQFGNTGTLGTGWSVLAGVKGYTKVLNGSLQSGEAGSDMVKVYLYAGERLYIDVDPTSGTGENPTNTVTRTVLDANGATTGFSQTTDGWFTASATGYYYVKLNAGATVNYNLVLTVDDGTSTAGGGTAAAPKGPIGPVAGSFEYTITETGTSDSARVDIYHVASDRLEGGGGNDILIGGASNDVLIGGAGNDVLQGGAGNDNLQGGIGADRLDGGAGNDVMDGGQGNDVLIGGLGNDTMTGGAGADQFVFNGTLNNGSDVITDFSTAQGDKLAFSGVSNLAALNPNWSATTSTMSFDNGSTLKLSGVTISTDALTWLQANAVLI